ncbi:lipopolysaccharide biosynthesis protein [Zoogloea sp.]|uniref:lipopolysaccharide biosynthesis protein n=1 Tax=Zoogloea sp. TaxID=49181 RepID=UPI0035B13EF7
MGLGELSRSKRAALTSVLNVVAQAVQVLTGLYSVPLSLNYLGQERFGLWMALSAILLFVSFSDFGVGIGAQDRISRDSAKGDSSSVRSVFWSALLFSLILGLFVFTIGVVVAGAVPLPAYFSLQSAQARSDVTPALQTILAILAVGVASGVVQRTFSALQQGYSIAVLQVISRLFSLGSLLLVVNLDLGLPALVFAVAGIPVAMILLIGLPTLITINPALKPSLEDFSLAQVKGLLGIGFAGLGASVAIYLVNSAGAFLISVRFGAGSLVDYSVVQRLINIPMMFVVYLLIPLWPAITDAKIKGDGEWIVRVYRKSSRAVFLFGAVCAVGLLVAGDWAIVLWTGDASVVPSTSLMLASVVFMLISFWNSLITTILNGYSRYRSQATLGVLIALASVVVGFVFPVSLASKELMVWIIDAGFAIRCLVLRREAVRMIGAGRV